MKAGVIVVSNGEVVGSNKNEILSLVCSQAYKNGIYVVCKTVLNLEPELIKKTLNQIREICDIIIFVSDTEFEKSYVCKKIICDEFKSELVNNVFAKNNIDEFLRKRNVPMKKEDATYFQLPKIARCVKNPLGVFQGFLVESENKMLFFLPLNYEELYHMFFSSALPYILQKRGETSCTYVFKTFGLTYNEMTSLLRDCIKNKLNIQVLCTEYLLDGEVSVLVPSNAKNSLEKVINPIYTKLLPYIYSDVDATLPEVISEFLQVRHKKIAFAEDFTCGKLANLFFEQNSSYHDVVSEGFIVPDNKSKIKTLNVDERIFLKPNIDLSEIAYQMALGALDKSGADFVVATYGDLTSNEIVFALGNKEGIHVYTEHVFGNKSQKILTACNHVLFKLLKKIKKDNFNLGETI